MESTESRVELQKCKYMLTPTELSSAAGVSNPAVSKAFSHYKLPQITGKSFGIPPKQIRDYLVAKGYNYDKKVIAHINLRGGIGKTTTTISGASRAVQYGHKVAIVDLDSQGSASTAFGIDPNDDDKIFLDVFQKPKEEVWPAMKEIQEDFHILPSSLDNGLLDSHLKNPKDQKHAVQNVCDALFAKGKDLIFIDCPPSLGSAIISTICAADIIVIPVKSDKFSFKGLQLTLKEIKSICDTFTLDLPEIRILYTAYDARTKASVDGLKTLVSEYNDYLIPTFIRASSIFDKAIKDNETVFANPRASTAKDDYDMYIRYILGIDAINEKKQ